MPGKPADARPDQITVEQWIIRWPPASDGPLRGVGSMVLEPRTALVHEWIAQAAGSEQVFAALARIFPSADLVALSRDPRVDIGLGSRPVRTTFLDRPWLRDVRGLTLPVMPLAWLSVRQPKYDLVVTSHHAFAMCNGLAAPGGLHLVYVHTPARYVWTPDVDGRGRTRLLSPARAALRAIDRAMARRRPTSLAANSATVAERIHSFWGRSARVIHPPVETGFFGAAVEPRMDLPEDYLLSLGRWVPYKRHDLAIAVSARLGLPAVVAGAGPMEGALRELAARRNAPVTFVRNPARDGVRELLSRARCLLFPVEEDFGMTPVEAQAAGTPVVGLRRGGLLETVRPGLTGELVAEPDVPSLADAVCRVDRLSAQACRENAQRFSVQVFEKKVSQWVASP